MDRRARGLDVQEFSIWKDGCEDAVDGIGVGKGESPAEMQARVDEVIEEIREIQGAGTEGREDVDILIVGFCSIGWRALADLVVVAVRFLIATF